MKILYLLLVVMLVFAACGRSTDELTEDGSGYVETPPVDVPQDTPAPPSPTPAPLPVAPAGYRHIVMEDGISQFSINMTVPDNLVSPWWSPRRGQQGGSIIIHEGHDDDGSWDWRRYLFELSEGVGHLDSWLRADIPEYEAWTGMFPRNSWVQPVAPSDVFVTQHGITVVRYENISREWEGWDLTVEEQQVWDWAAATPPRRYGDYTTAVYFFRQDGQDVRDFGAQIFFYIIVFAMEDRFSDLDAQARGILESLYFSDVPEITLTPTATAVAIGINGGNYPRINGSTSTIPLVQNIFMSMFEHTQGRGLDDRFIFSMWDWDPYWLGGAARTIPSYELLIGNYVDMILVPEPSVAALRLAEDAGVELEFTPVAVEALVFLTSMENPVYDITREQLLGIYSDRSITNWAQLGGLDGAIVPLNRNLHSGSQTLMDNLVLRQEEMHETLTVYQIGGMEDMLTAINHAWVLLDAEPNTFTIGYTVYYFLQQQVANQNVPWGGDASEFFGGIRVMSFDGVTPTSETIASGEYALTTHYYAVIRADSAEGSPERLIRDWLLTEEGQNAVERATLGRVR
ncbi:MAG: substrate-binding domain-containing protein [Defluviitaleaceae bacterium]|nr:substrate-binding domain-containing protein [Defluviitaleaceae bacterium]